MNNLNSESSKHPCSHHNDTPEELVGNEADDDFQLVTLAQKGDMRAYDELIIRHRGKIYAMIHHMIRNEADAWDLSQEVFIKAWKALPNFESRSRFSTWLYRIAHNALYDLVRKQKTQSAGELNDEILNRDLIDSSAKTVPAAIDAPDEALSHSELRQKIESSLAKLSAEHREAILLKDAQGLSYKEIADVMQCTIGTVMSRLFYARQKLQILLKDEYESR